MSSPHLPPQPGLAIRPMPQASPASTPLQSTRTEVAGKPGLPLVEYFGYALGDTASCFFFWTFNIFLTYYYIDVWGLAAAAISVMMLGVRFGDAVADLGMGLVADRTTTRWGKFRPYLLWGAVPYGLFGYLMFAAPELGSSGKLAYAWVTYALMLLAYTAINVPYNALLGVLSPSPGVRAVASSFRFAGANAGGLLVSLFVRPLVQRLGDGSEMDGFRRTMALFAIVSIAFFVASFATTRERVTPPPAQRTDVKEELRELVRNVPWVVLLVAAVFSTSFIVMRSTSTLFYFKYYVGDDGAPYLWFLDRPSLFLATGMLCQVAGNFGLATVAARIDKRNLAVLLTTITAVCLGLFYIIPKDAFGLQLAVNALGALCMGPTSALLFAMYGDVADYGEWKFGRRSTGLVYSASLFALKTGTTVGGVLMPLFLQLFDFKAGAEQSPKALLGINLAFSVAPAIFALAKAGALWWFPLDRAQVARITEELAARREPAAAQAT